VRLAAARNIAKAWLLTAVLTAPAGALGYALNGWSGATLFVFCALLAATAVYAYGDRVLLGMLGAREYALAEDPILRSTVDTLAAKAGVEPPRLYVIADGFPRSFAAGRGPRGSSIALSTGLLAALPPAELAGVVAHELAHVRARDVLVQTLAVVVAVVVVDISRVGGWFERGLRSVLAPIAAAFVHLLLSPKRELAADSFAASLLGTPHGLAAALVRLDGASDLLVFEAHPATEPLYPVDPFAPEGLAALFSSHPPLDRRLARLRAVAPDERANGRAA
jgi:heat shock protein HtpX